MFLALTTSRVHNLHKDKAHNLSLSLLHRKRLSMCMCVCVCMHAVYVCVCSVCVHARLCVFRKEMGYAKTRRQVCHFLQMIVQETCIHGE